MTAVLRRREANGLRHYWLWLISFALLGVLVAQPVWLFADDPQVPTVEEEDEPSPFRGGVIARYTGTDGIARVRLEDEIAFAWGAEPPERRVPAGPFSAQFDGYLD